MPNLLAYAALVGSMSNFAFGWNIGQEVNTTSGRVAGHASLRHKEVSEYLGIPYAQPPVGSLRFMPPQKFKGGGIIKADKFSAYVVSASTRPYTSLKGSAAAIIAEQGQVNHTLNEDCLTLNIWTRPQTGEAKKAVLLWLHGGGFNIGASSSPAYDGSTLANDEDVVIVSINYRLNIFGFPAAPGLVDQNPGLLDQRLAVEWVRDNIRNFGGDPSRITLFGESAGGIAVDLYAYAWTADPIINGFIAQSGTALLRVSGVKVGDYSEWYGVSKKLGCGGLEAGEKTIPCMQGKKVKDILASWTSSPDFSKSNAFGVYPDNRTAWSDFFIRGKRGQFIKRPLLVGHNNLESGLFRFLQERLGKVSENALRVIDEGYACPPGAAASYRITHGVKAWRYRYHGVFPNQELTSKSGAYHSSEIPLIFGTSSDTGADTPDEMKLAKNMQHAWAMFAKDPEKGLSGLGWPVYDQNGRTLVQLGLGNKPEPVFEDNKVYDGKCPSYVEEALVSIV